MAVLGSVAAAVLCLGGFGAVVAGAGPGDALYGLRTMLFGEQQVTRDDQVVLAAKTELAEVQQLIERGQWDAAQDKLAAVTTTVATVDDVARKQELVDQWQELSVKVETKDANATVPPGAPPATLPRCRRSWNRLRRETSSTITPDNHTVVGDIDADRRRRRRPRPPPTHDPVAAAHTDADPSPPPTPTRLCRRTAPPTPSPTPAPSTPLPTTDADPVADPPIPTPAPSTPIPTPTPSTPIPTPSPLPTPSSTVVATPLPTPTGTTPRATPLPTPSAQPSETAQTSQPPILEAPAPRTVYDHDRRASGTGRAALADNRGAGG